MLLLDVVFSQMADKDWESDNYPPGESEEKKKKRNMDRFINTIITYPEWILTPGRRLHIKFSLVTGNILVSFEEIYGMVNKTSDPVVLTRYEWGSFVHNSEKILKIMENLDNGIWIYAEDDKNSSMPGDKIIKFRVNCSDAFYIFFRFNKTNPQKYYVEFVKKCEGCQIINGEFSPSLKDTRFLMNAPCMKFFMKEIMPEIRPCIRMWMKMRKSIEEEDDDEMPSWVNLMKMS